MQDQMAFEFASKPPQITAQAACDPKGYIGLYGFHKYWGKKPHELLAFLVEHLTSEGDTIFDPFVGSGTAARESALRNRRFIGFDINPVAVELTRLLVSPPKFNLIRDAFTHLEKCVKDSIRNTYLLEDGLVASHFLWDNDQLQRVWLRDGRRNARVERPPTAHDLNVIRGLSDYRSTYLRQPTFFSNGRINASIDLTTSDILTGRAQHNLDLLMAGIAELDHDIATVLRLCLTAASGQMSKMVFAVTGRGKTTGKISSKVEVGSWVIGYWRPKLHFEVNVWNCFERRALKLLQSLKNGDPLTCSEVAHSVEEFYGADLKCCIACAPSQEALERIADHSIKLILTDPPHSDRVPYLELSELWNAILGEESRFDAEFVISNAKERRKTPETYSHDMNQFFSRCRHKLRDDGLLVLLYNARQEGRWDFVKKMITDSDNSGLTYFGKFPCNYSAGSVVQDNRKGGLKNDVALVFGSPTVGAENLRPLRTLPNWSDGVPFERGATNGL